MRVTIENEVCDLLEVKIEFMFNNGKGRMIQRTDIWQEGANLGFPLPFQIL